MSDRVIPRWAGFAAVAAMVAMAAPARADAIDGSWCAGDGRHLAIEGPQIVTPGGTRMTGNYDRHAFAYTVPAREPGAGSGVNMILLDEDTMQLSISGGPPQTWRRCPPPTS